MKRFFAFSLILSAALCHASGFQTLRMAADSRTASMGFTATSLTTTGASAYYNPAAAVGSHQELMFSLQNWIQDVQSRFVGYSKGDGVSGWGAYLFYSEISEIEHRLNQPTPDPISTFSAYDLAFGLSYGHRIAENVSLGISAKLLYEKIYLNSAWGAAGDFGITWSVIPGSFLLTGAVQNLGQASKHLNESTDLPLINRAGAAFNRALPFGRVMITAEGVKEKDTPLHWGFGGELLFQDYLFIRGGYQTGYEDRSVSGGFGLKYSRYCFDYSYAPFESGLGDASHFTLRILW